MKIYNTHQPRYSLLSVVFFSIHFVFSFYLFSFFSLLISYFARCSLADRCKRVSLIYRLMQLRLYYSNIACFFFISFFRRQQLNGRLKLMYDIKILWSSIVMRIIRIHRGKNKIASNTKIGSNVSALAMRPMKTEKREFISAIFLLICHSHS